MCLMNLKMYFISAVLLLGQPVIQPFAFADNSSSSGQVNSQGQGHHHGPGDLPPEVKAAADKCKTTVDAKNLTDEEAKHEAFHQCMSAAGFKGPPHDGHGPHNMPPEVKAAFEKCHDSVEATKPADHKAFHQAMEACMTKAGFPKPKDAPKDE